MVVAGLLAALFIGALDVTVVSTAMPRITEELQGLHLMNWIFSIYTLTTCVTTPIFGKLTDLFGRKSVFVIGVAIFVVGSILCGMAESMTALILFRAVQGIGAGAITPVCFTIVGDIFPGEKRGKMMGVLGSVWSVAGLLGPLVGGYFVDQASWRWIFYINVPIGIAALVLVIGFLHENIERKNKKIDYLGAFTFTVALSSLLYALLSGGDGEGQHPWDSPLILTMLAVAAVFFASFLAVEKKAEEPMLPLDLFKIRVLNVTNISGFFAFAVVTGMTIYPPYWIQSVLGYTATESGLAVMPMSLAWPLAAIIVGRTMYRMGIKATMAAGSAVVLASVAWLAFIDASSPLGSWIAIMAIFGFGMGYVSTPSTVLVQSVVGWDKRGVANSTNVLMRSLGQSIGVAVFGSIFNSYLSTNETVPELASGMQAVFLFFLALSAANLVAVLFLPSHGKVMEQQRSH